MRERERGREGAIEGAREGGRGRIDGVMEEIVHQAAEIADYGVLQFRVFRELSSFEMERD